MAIICGGEKRSVDKVSFEVWFGKIKVIEIQKESINLFITPGLILQNVIIQGVQTLSDKSNFAAILRKIDQKSRVRIFSWSLMRNNLF